MRLTKEEEARRMALYNQGLCDREIAEQVIAEKSTIWKWRERHHLPPNYYQGFNRRKKYYQEDV